MQQHVVEHRAQRVVGVLARGRYLDRLRDGDPERSRGMCLLGAPGAGQRARGSVHRRPPGLHHRSPIRLLVIGGADHEHLALEPEQGAGESKCGAPLACPCLRGETLDAGARILVGLGYGRVWLMRASGREPLVLVVDTRRCAQLALEAPGAEQRRGAPQLVRLAHLLGNRDLGLGRDLLFDECKGKDRRQVARTGGLEGLRVQRRQRLSRQVHQQVYPMRGYIALREQELHRLIGHSRSLSDVSSQPTARPAAPRALEAERSQPAVDRLG